MLCSVCHRGGSQVLSGFHVISGQTVERVAPRTDPRSRGSTVVKWSAHCSVMHELRLQIASSL